MSVYWIQTLEDPRHAWCKAEGSPVVVRARFSEALEATTVRALCMAGPFRPMEASLLVSSEWDPVDRSFAATWLDGYRTLSNTLLPPTKASSQPRASFGKPMR